MFLHLVGQKPVTESSHCQHPEQSKHLLLLSQYWVAPQVAWLAQLPAGREDVVAGAAVVRLHLISQGQS